MVKNILIFILLIILFGIFGIMHLKKLKEPSIKEIGSFEYEGSKTQVIQAGNCEVYMTKFKNSEEVRYFFNCPSK